MSVVVDWSLRLGDMVSFSGFAIGGLSVIFIMKSDIRVLAVRLGFLEETVKKETQAQNVKIDKQSDEIGKLGEFLSITRLQDERMLLMRRDIDEMRHGRGFVVPPPFITAKEG